MAEIYYKQVKLNNYIYDRVYEHVVWIPEYFAVVGKFISVLDVGVWRYGWRVVEVYEGRKSEQDILNMENNYNYFRKLMVE